MPGSFLEDILSQPTVPFRESHVIKSITRQFDAQGVPYFEDPIGNIVVGVGSKKAYLALLSKSTKEPLRLFIAHMDHPGFHGEEWLSESKLKIKWYGGSPTQLLEGASVWLASENGWLGGGKFSKVQVLEDRFRIDSAEVQVLSTNLSQKFPKAKDLFGAFQFRAPYWREGELIYTKAADDLVGAFTVSTLALKHFTKKRNVVRMKPLQNFVGLLTRAEEVGAIGAIAHFELGWLRQAKRPVLCVSLEASRTLPGADIGKGPVVRLGDRATVFNPGALQVFTDLAKKVLPNAHQRRIMDGGTCEASVAVAYGFPTVGISIPLGNYHNQSYEGGPDSRGPQGPGPEFVHEKDIEGMIKLGEALLRPGLPWDQPWKEKIARFRQMRKQASSLLKGA